MATLKRRVEQLERLQSSPGPKFSREFDDDALAIYNCMAYLDATMEPSYHEVEATAIYRRGQTLRDKLYGPIIPCHLDDHHKLYTRASGEFELAFGREPREGDQLRCQHVALMHIPENDAIHFGKMIEAWQRQLPQLTCPLRFEGGRLFKRLRPERRGEEAKWEEFGGIQWVERWYAIPEVVVNSNIRASEPVLGVMFLGVAGGRHQCRPATAEELQRPDSESPITDPTGFMFANQRFCEVLVDVMGM
jgi:hypothetical protein